MSTDRKENPSRRERVMPGKHGRRKPTGNPDQRQSARPRPLQKRTFAGGCLRLFQGYIALPPSYPGEDGDTFEQLLDELAIALGPADVIEWLLVADLRSVIFDERRYRCALALFLSPGKLIEPEPSEMAVRVKEIIEARRHFLKDNSISAKKNMTIFSEKIYKEVVQKPRNPSVLWKKPMPLSYRAGT